MGIDALQALSVKTISEAEMERERELLKHFSQVIDICVPNKRGHEIRDETRGVFGVLELRMS